MCFDKQYLTPECPVIPNQQKKQLMYFIGANLLSPQPLEAEPHAEPPPAYPGASRGHRNSTRNTFSSQSASRWHPRSHCSRRYTSQRYLHVQSSNLQSNYMSCLPSALRYCRVRLHPFDDYPPRLYSLFYAINRRFVACYHTPRLPAILHNVSGIRNMLLSASCRVDHSFASLQSLIHTFIRLPQRLAKISALGCLPPLSIWYQHNNIASYSYFSRII